MIDARLHVVRDACVCAHPNLPTLNVLFNLQQVNESDYPSALGFDPTLSGATTRPLSSALVRSRPLIHRVLRTLE